LSLMQPKSIVSKNDVWRLPCHADAPGDVPTDRTVIPLKSPAGHTPEIRRSEGKETYQSDRALHATLARLTGGISPIALSLAYIDWALHLAAAPQRQMEISENAWRSAGRVFESAAHWFAPGQGPWSLIKPQPQDRRFADPEWERPPFNLLAQAFLLHQQWWHDSARRSAVERGNRRVLDAASAGHAGPIQFRRDQSRSVAESLPEWW
jgi:polyhydroxyalkanoate synthase